MSDSIQVRHGRAEDLPLIHRFIRELAAYEKLEADCTGTMEQLRETLFGEAPSARVLLAFAGGQPAGFAVYFFTYSTFAASPLLYLEDLFVKPEARGSGVGRRLFGELRRIAEAKGCARLEWTVLDWNREAIEFNERLGATPNPAWLKYSLALPTRDGPGTLSG